MTHLHEDDLTLFYYGELPAAEEGQARAHLERCGECRERHAALVRLFAVVDTCPVPEPAGEFEAQVWRRLQPALRSVRERERSVGFAERLRGWFVPAGLPRWTTAGALVALVLVAFAAGRFWPSQHAEPVSTPAADARPDDLRERVLLSALGDHFDRTQAMLVDLASTSSADPADISHEQRRAEDLISATRLYRRAALEAGDRNVADVLEALERVLAEITMSPSTLSAYELGGLQRRIEEQELLFKLRIASSAVRDRQINRHAGIES
jgi:hypothetical protein